MLPNAIQDGYRYWTSLSSKENVLTKIKKRDGDGDPGMANKKKPKKLKEVYLVAKKKFWSEGTNAELAQDLSQEVPSDVEDLRRIIQFKIR